MVRSLRSDEALATVMMLCKEAVAAQRDLERRHGYGLDDYTDGRTVGAANLARKILRALEGERLPAAIERRGGRPTV